MDPPSAPGRGPDWRAEKSRVKWPGPCNDDASVLGNTPPRAMTRRRNRSAPLVPPVNDGRHLTPGNLCTDCSASSGLAFLGFVILGRSLRISVFLLGAAPCSRAKAMIGGGSLRRGVRCEQPTATTNTEILSLRPRMRVSPRQPLATPPTPRVPTDPKAPTPAPPRTPPHPAARTCRPEVIRTGIASRIGDIRPLSRNASINAPPCIVFRIFGAIPPPR